MKAMGPIQQLRARRSPSARTSHTTARRSWTGTLSQLIPGDIGGIYSRFQSALAAAFASPRHSALARFHVIIGRSKTRDSRIVARPDAENLLSQL